MAAAMRPFTNAGGAMLMGTDTPSLPVKLLVKNADLFETNPIVIAPTLDGGYYLVAMRGKLTDIFKPMELGQLRRPRSNAGAPARGRRALLPRALVV